MPIALPIDTLLPQILSHAEKVKNLVLQASPGSGKTTRVPPALLNSRFISKTQEILVLEPRRLAAKYAALRVAMELGGEVGQLVGYQFRFENKTSASTRLRFLTEGMLMKRLMSDPELKKVAVVILDEFHERHLHTDLAIGVLRHLQMTTRPDLRIVVMSATLDTQKVAAFLGNAPILNLETQLYPVECTYLEGNAKPLEHRVRDAVKAQLAMDPTGDILVFLPGMREIRRALSTLEDSLRNPSLLLLPLHGELDRKEQDRAILKQDKRKIILSTNVAETSLTIEGVSCVIDSGLQRQASYSWWSGVPLLATKAISKASAIQRAGRAGRTGPGRCVRLYTKSDFDTRPAFEVPELLRADLAQTLLEMNSLGIPDPLRFDWYETPKPSAVEAAQSLLYQLGATDQKTGASRLTPRGHRMTEISAHPRISRFLIECESAGELEKGATLAALISEGMLDSLESIDTLTKLERPLDFNTTRARSQLLSTFGAIAPSKGMSHDKIARCLLSAFGDRVAKKRNQKEGPNRLRSGEVELILSSGGSVTIPNADSISAEIRSQDFFIALEVSEQKDLQAKNRLRVHSLCPIQEDWLWELEPSPLVESEELSWDATRECLRSTSQISLGQIVLDQKEREPQDEEASVRIWVREVFRSDPERLANFTLTDWIRFFETLFEPQSVESLLGRIRLCSESGLPRPEILHQFLRVWVKGKRRLMEVKDPSFFSALTECCLGEMAPMLQQKTPEFLTLPGGRRLPIHYPIDQAPWIASRLQDFFGLKEGPRILNGSVTLTLHLLAPNQRAVQVTSDLRGFWDRVYPTLRKELSRRYPRHSWPENPLLASPPIPKKKH